MPLLGAHSITRTLYAIRWRAFCWNVHDLSIRYENGGCENTLHDCHSMESTNPPRTLYATCVFALNCVCGTHSPNVYNTVSSTVSLSSPSSGSVFVATMAVICLCVCLYIRACLTVCLRCIEERITVTIYGSFIQTALGHRNEIHYLQRSSALPVVWYKYVRNS